MSRPRSRDGADPPASPPAGTPRSPGRARPAPEHTGRGSTTATRARGERGPRGDSPREGTRPPRALPARRRSRTWGVYLVPLLVVITVLAVVQSMGGEVGESPSGPSGGSADPGPPVVGEAPQGSANDVDIPTAELPAGGEFPVRGDGSWHVVPGTGPQVGTGRVFTYTVEVEDGAVLPEGDAAFATAVDATLSDPRSWVGSGRIAMRRVDASSGVAPDFRVSLSSQLTTRAQCGYAIRFEASCWKSDIGRVLINGARWVRGAGAFDGQLGLYRQYAINHEIGHVFRNQHVPCPGPGVLAPVMMQQSFGTSNDYLAQLTEENPQGTQIPRNGATCQPNPWPYPEGSPTPAG